MFPDTFAAEAVMTPSGIDLVRQVIPCVGGLDGHGIEAAVIGELEGPSTAVKVSAVVLPVMVALRMFAVGGGRVEGKPVDPQLRIAGVLGFDELGLAEIGQQAGRGRAVVDDEVVARAEFHAPDLQPKTAAVVDHAGADVIAVVGVGVDEARELRQGRGAGHVYGDLTPADGEGEGPGHAAADNRVLGGKYYRPHVHVIGRQGKHVHLMGTFFRIAARRGGQGGGVGRDRVLDQKLVRGVHGVQGAFEGQHGRGERVEGLALGFPV
jgi:hypothetical protein